MSSTIVIKIAGLALMFAAVVVYVARRYGGRPGWLRESPAVMIVIVGFVLAVLLGAWVLQQQ